MNDAMEILAFFSFKGGVGRTALMTNLAAYWASLGRVVGLVDMDLAAPGLSYSPLLAKEPLEPEMEGRGFSDLLAAYHKGRDDKDGLGYFPPTGLFREMRPLQGVGWGNNGRILVMGAGEVHFRYPLMAEEGTPSAFPAKDGRKNESNADRALRAFATLLRRDMQAFRLPAEQPGRAGRKLDHLLIDCRTGFPELLDMVLGYLADRMVLVSGLNEQNRIGLDLTLAALRKERVPEGRYARDLVTVFSPVPAHFHDDPTAREALKEGKKIIDRHRVQPQDRQPEEGPKVFTLPYTPRLAVSDLPLTAQDLDHPYSRHVLEIADFLDGQSVEKQKEAVSEKLIRFGGAAPKTATSNPDKIYGIDLKAALGKMYDHPIMQLPHWHWPLSLDPKQTVKPQAWRDEHLPKRDDLPGFDRDLFLDALSGSIALDKTQKERAFASYAQLSPLQVQELVNTFQEERQRFSSLPKKEIETFQQQLQQSQMAWADLIVSPPREGLRRFLLWPLEGRTPFPAWVSLPEYWCRLARDLRGELGLRERALEAVDHALALVPLERTLAALLDLLDPHDASWTKQVLERARTLAGKNLWLQFQVLQKEPAPDVERVNAVLNPLLEQEPPEDADRCFHLAVWVLDHHPRFGAQTEPFLRCADALDQDNAYILNTLSNVICYHGRFEEAEAVYRKAISLDDNFAYPWHGLGNVLLELKRFDEAEAAYRKASLWMVI